MNNKKIILSVTATAAIAAACASADEVEAASYKVKNGDSLWTISQKYGVSISNLKSINKLVSDTIHPGQTIETSKKTSTSSTNLQHTSQSTAKPGKPAASGGSYTIKPGDTLSGIAASHGVSLSTLMSWNNMTTTLIYPGQQLKVGTSAPSNNSNTAPSAKPTVPPTGNTGSSSVVHNVKSGDTLSGIAAQYKVSVSDIKSWNGLNNDIIYIGQNLTVKGSKVSPPADAPGKPVATPPTQTGNATPTGSYNVSSLISAAKAQLGVPYVWGGASTSGFDCSGFIYYTYTQAGKPVARTSAEGYFDRSFYISTPQVGDLVFFKNTYKSGISHLGVYLGGGNFIHAGGDQVQISNVNSKYWSDHFDSYKRFY